MYNNIYNIYRPFSLHPSLFIVNCKLLNCKFLDFLTFILLFCNMDIAKESKKPKKSKKVSKYFVSSNKSSTFAPAFRKEVIFLPLSSGGGWRAWKKSRCDYQALTGEYWKKVLKNFGSSKKSSTFAVGFAPKGVTVRKSGLWMIGTIDVVQAYGIIFHTKNWDIVPVNWVRYLINRLFWAKL